MEVSSTAKSEQEMTRKIIGIDVGTGGTRAVLVGRKRRPAGVGDA